MAKKIKKHKEIGLDYYSLKTCEEAGELIQAISKVGLGKWPVSRLASEIADVEIMLAQLKIIYNIQNEVPKAKEIKLKKLEKKNKK